MRPVIGITCYVERAEWGVWDQPAALIPLTYVRAVQEAGGRAVLIPPDDDGAAEMLDDLDGLVLSGGADIDPQVYGETSDATMEVRPDRDRSEIALANAALDRDMPVLGICRGMQLLNVARGGTLIPDLEADGAGVSHKEAPGVFARHEVTIEPDSRLCSILGDRSAVASHHHQAPDRLGRGLRATGTAPDGVVEAIEDPDARMVVGVLWHPEEGEDRALFETLVERAAEYGRERS